MRSALVVGLGAVAALGAACGGSNPGGGTKNLYVEVQAVSDGSSDGTWMAVQIRDGSSSGPLVQDATVQIRGDKTGELYLPWQGVSWGGWTAGAYAKGNLLWDTGWALNIKRGNDGLDGYLQAPGHTVITQPIANTTFSLANAQPLLVKWEDDMGHRAEAVTVELHQSQFVRQLSEDPLQLSIPVNNLQGPTDERVEVTRTNEVNLAGGTPGSVFRASTHHSIQFRVE